MTILPPPPEKRSYVRRMFAAIAPRYDLVNRLMTFGRDQVWRRTVVRLCALPVGGRLLDVATGTGDIAYEALRADPTVRVVGLDLTREMMLYGRGKRARPHPLTPSPEVRTFTSGEGEIAGEGSPSPDDRFFVVRRGGQGGEAPFPFTEGDALALPFPDNSFDAACSGFMMRNVTDVRAAFAEQARVVRPGGRVVCLEITRPGLPVFDKLFHFYFFRLVPLIGGLVSGQREAYTYLPHSTLAFPRSPELARIMESVGLRDVRWRTAMLGTVALHWGTK